MLRFLAILGLLSLAMYNAGLIAYALAKTFNPLAAIGTILVLAGSLAMLRQLTKESTQ